MLDDQLKRVLAKLLPSMLLIASNRLHGYLDSLTKTREVKDTELLYLCSLVELELKKDNFHSRKMLRVYRRSIKDATFDPEFATWQERVIALAEASGIKIQ